MKQVVCFGAGKFGKLYARSVAESDKPVSIFIDNDAIKWGTECEGIKIFPPGHLSGLVGDTTVIVAVSKAAGQDNVISQLTDMGFVYGKDLFSYLHHLEDCAARFISERFVCSEAIDFGFSPCLKYSVTDKHNSRRFLRISAISQYGRRKTEYELLQTLSQADVPVPRMLEFGCIDTCVYAVYDWVEGTNLDAALQSLPQETQHELGVLSGQALRKIHKMPLLDFMSSFDDVSTYNVDDIRARYLTQGEHSEINDIIFDYIDQNKYLRKNRPTVLLHGDYALKNQMLEKKGIRIMDFDKAHLGDPFSELGMIVYSAIISPVFAIGQLRGYFEGEVPNEAWPYIAFYATCTAAYYALRTKNYPNSIKNEVTENNIKVVSWFGNMRSYIPCWYSNLWESA